MLDHVYVTNPVDVIDLCHSKPCFGDHELIIVKVSTTEIEKQVSWRIDWRNYSKNKLSESLSKMNCNEKYKNCTRLLEYV